MRHACSLALSVIGFSAIPGAQAPAPAVPATPSTALDRYLSTVGDRGPSYRARRVLSAKAGSREATLVAMTSIDAGGEFTYEIISEQGSGIIRSKVLRAALDAEQKAKSRAQASRAAVTSENYTFEAAGATGDGCERILIKPRRNDAMMIDGSIIVQAIDGDLLQVEGTLVKRPSFWVRHVEIERKYARIAGARVPVSMSSVADVLFVGKSNFDMRYEYEAINGVAVGAPPAPAMSHKN
jgi:hypothetical protein